MGMRAACPAVEAIADILDIESNSAISREASWVSGAGSHGAGFTLPTPQTDAATFDGEMFQW